MKDLFETLLLFIVAIITGVICGFSGVCNNTSDNNKINQDSIIVANQTIITKLLIQNSKRIEKMWIDHLTTDELKEYYSKLEPDNKQKEIKHDDKGQ